MSEKCRPPPVALPKAVDQELKAFVRSFIMDHIPEDPNDFILYAADYFNRQKDAIMGNGGGTQGKDGSRPVPYSSRAGNRPQVLQKYRNDSGAAGTVWCPPPGDTTGNDNQLLGPHKSDFISGASHHDLNPTESQIRNSYHCCYCIEGKGVCKCNSLDDFDVNSPSLATLATETAGSDWWHTEKSEENLHKIK